MIVLSIIKDFSRLIYLVIHTPTPLFTSDPGMLLIDPWGDPDSRPYHLANQIKNYYIFVRRFANGYRLADNVI